VRFLRFNLSSHKKIEFDLGKVGLTPPQFYVLATIGYAGSLPFGEIGAKMMVTVSNLTGIVDRLEEKNWLCESATIPTDVLFTSH
jgi:DNA-binding MarR family transcriptional regulator